MKQTLRYALIDLSRWIGRQICKLRGHRYYHAGGAYDSHCAYGCLRCGELDRPIESLPPTTPDEYGDWPEALVFNGEQEQYEHARCWFSWAPYPKWI